MRTGINPRALGLAPITRPPANALKHWPFKDPPPASVYRDAQGRVRIPQSQCSCGTCAVCVERAAFEVHAHREV